MKLSRLEIFGFKSFAKKLDLKLKVQKAERRVREKRIKSSPVRRTISNALSSLGKTLEEAGKNESRLPLTDKPKKKTKKKKSKKKKPKTRRKKEPEYKLPKI